MGKRVRRPAHTGVLKVDKPSGVTSHDVVRIIRRQMGQREVGHTGTLDPMATGLLILTLGRATRIGRFLEAAEKAYEGTVVLGQATDTYDAEGAVVAESPVPPLSLDAVERAVAGFEGALEQRVPAFSAVKVDGERLHAKARRGDAVEAPVRTVHIHAIRVVGWDSPRIDIEVVCSKGTYIRTLATQIGEALGLPAHLGRLRRTRVGPHAVEDAVVPDRSTPGDLMSMPVALQHLPQIRIGDEAEIDVRHGRPLTFAQLEGRLGERAFEAEDPLALIGPSGDLLAVGLAVTGRHDWASRPPRDRALRYACVLSA